MPISFITTQTLSAELEERGLEPLGHTARLVQLVESIGQALRLDEDSLTALTHAALLHDVGKLVLPERIILKTGPLDEEEWTIIRTHPRWSFELARAIPGVHPRALKAVLYHHERWDGSGYPEGLQGDQIPIEARVLAVCDVYDTLLSKRPYGRPWNTQAVLEELSVARGRHFDPTVVDVFFERALGKLTLVN